MSNHSLGFQKLGIDLSKVRGNASTCPNCSESRRKKNQKCLSINLDNGFYNCNHCDFTGRVDSNEWINKSYTKPTTNHFKTLKTQKSKVYDKPKSNLVELSSQSLAYFKSRGIDERVLTRNKVMETKTGDIAFQFLNDGELVAAKFRKTKEKSFYQIPNCKPILYKLDDIKRIPYVIICEGEIDALSWEQLGLTGAVSIDKGAPNKGSNVGTKLDCLRTCYNFLQDKEDVYISVDNDENGNYLKEILIDRFGRDKCHIIEYPNDCKDANDVLMKYGTAGLEKCFNEAKKVPVHDSQKLEDVYDEILADFDAGVEMGEDCGFEAISKNFSWIKRFMYLWTGIPNHGKSAVLNFLMILKSLQDGTKWAVFSPEHAPAKQFYKALISLYTGKSFNKKKSNAITVEEINRSKEFINNHFIFIYPEDDESATNEDAMQSPKWILEKIVELKLCEGIGGFVIDPWNQLDHLYKDIKREDQYLSHWFKQFKKISQMHNLFCNIVAHPKGMLPSKEGIVRKPTAYDISGGAMWNNKFDVITVIHRPKFYTDKLDTSVLFDVQKAKEQYRFGRPDCIEIDFDPETGWYKSMYDESPLENVFNSVTNLELKREVIETLSFEEIVEEKPDPMQLARGQKIEF